MLLIQRLSYLVIRNLSLLWDLVDVDMILIIGLAQFEMALLVLPARSIQYGVLRLVDSCFLYKFIRFQQGLSNLDKLEIKLVDIRWVLLNICFFNHNIHLLHLFKFIGFQLYNIPFFYLMIILLIQKAWIQYALLLLFV